MKRVLLLFSLSLPLSAQSERNYAFQLNNGLTVLYQVWTEADTRKAEGGSTAFGSAEARGNSVLRTLLDKAGKPVLGFSVDFERLESERSIRISVAPHPDHAVPFFSSPPAPRNVLSGDRIFLDVMTNPSTGTVNYDRFQVGDDSTPMQILPMPARIPRVVRQSVPLTFGECRLFSRNTDITGVVPSQLDVAIATINASGHGRFRFSSLPLGNSSRLEGIVEGNHLQFVHGRKPYIVMCRQRIAATMNDPFYIWITADNAVAAATTHYDSKLVSAQSFVSHSRVPVWYETQIKVTNGPTFMAEQAMNADGSTVHVATPRPNSRFAPSRVITNVADRTITFVDPVTRLVTVQPMRKATATAMTRFPTECEQFFAQPNISVTCDPSDEILHGYKVIRVRFSVVDSARGSRTEHEYLVAPDLTFLPLKELRWTNGKLTEERIVTAIIVGGGTDLFRVPADYRPAKMSDYLRARDESRGAKPDPKYLADMDAKVERSRLAVARGE